MLKQTQHMHKYWFVMSSHWAKRVRVTKARPQSSFYISSVSKQWAASHFWNLYCEAASLLKPYLSCLAADSGYSHIQKNKKRNLKMFCKTTMKGMCCVWSEERNSSLFGNRLLGIVTASLSLSGHIDKMDINTEQGRNGSHLSSDTLSVQQSKKKKICGVVMSAIITLSACGGNRTGCAWWELRGEGEFTVLIKTPTGHLWEMMCKVRKKEMWRIVRQGGGGGGGIFHCDVRVKYICMNCDRLQCIIKNNTSQQQPIFPGGNKGGIHMVAENSA